MSGDVTIFFWKYPSMNSDFFTFNWKPMLHEINNWLIKERYRPIYPNFNTRIAKKSPLWSQCVSRRLSDSRSHVIATNLLKLQLSYHGRTSSILIWTSPSSKTAWTLNPYKETVVSGTQLARTTTCLFLYLFCHWCYKYWHRWTSLLWNQTDHHGLTCIIHD